MESWPRLLEGWSKANLQPDFYSYLESTSYLCGASQHFKLKIVYTFRSQMAIRNQDLSLDFELLSYNYSLPIKPTKVLIRSCGGIAISENRIAISPSSPINRLCNSQSYQVILDLNQLIEKDTLQKQPGIVKDNAFVVVCDVDFEQQGPISQFLFSPTVKSLYNVFFDNENFADVVFLIKDSGDVPKRIFFSKGLLIQKCEYFAAMFDGFHEDSTKILSPPETKETPLPILKGEDDLAEDEEKLTTENSSSTTSTVPINDLLYDSRGDGKMISQISIDDFLYDPFRAFLSFIMTDVIDFAPIDGSSAETTWMNASEGACPKAVYEIAHRYGHEELQNLCLDALVKSVSKSNIAQELFSEFTYKYEGPRNRLRMYLVTNLEQIKREQSLKDVFMHGLAEGSDHTETWDDLFDYLVGNKRIWI